MLHQVLPGNRRRPKKSPGRRLPATVPGSHGPAHRICRKVRESCPFADRSNGPPASGPALRLSRGPRVRAEPAECQARTRSATARRRPCRPAPPSMCPRCLSPGRFPTPGPAGRRRKNFGDERRGHGPFAAHAECHQKPQGGDLPQRGREVSHSRKDRIAQNRDRHHRFAAEPVGQRAKEHAAGCSAHQKDG